MTNEETSLQQGTFEEASLTIHEGSTFREKLKDETYFTFLMIGIGLLWPWNCILSSSVYFINDIFHGDTIWATGFTSSMMSTSTFTSLIFNTWLAKRQHSYSKRVRRGLIWEIIVFSFLGLIAIIHHILPMALSFVIIMFLVAISSIGTGLSQNGIFAIANIYGSEYSQAVVIGQAIAGVAPSLVLVFTALFGSDSDGMGLPSILMYLLTTVAVSAYCLVLYKKNSLDSKLPSSGEITSDETTTEVPFSLLYLKLKWLLLAILMTFIVTMVFPVFASTTKPMGPILNDATYSAFAFTIWNAGDVCGRIVAARPYFRDVSYTAARVFRSAISRIILVPLFFLFTHYNTKERSRGYTILDLLYMFWQFIFGLTNGQIVSVAFMKIPEYLDTEVEKEAAGGFTSIFVFIGLTFGSILSYLTTFIVNKMLQQQG